MEDYSSPGPFTVFFKSFIGLLDNLLIILQTSLTLRNLPDPKFTFPT